MVVGLGDTGLSVMHWLLRHPVTLRCADSRTEPPALAELLSQYPGLQVHTAAFGDDWFDPLLLEGVDLLVCSPGISLHIALLQEASARGISIVGDVELFARACPPQAKVIGITGSNGKSTVTTLVGELCRAQGLRTVVAGNIGLPVLDALQANPDAEVFVLELSSFQLETTYSLRLDVATVLNISEDHLDRYRDMSAYQAAKARIFAHCSMQVLNLDDPASIAMAQSSQPLRTFSLTDTSADFALTEDAHGGHLMAMGQPLIATQKLKLTGRHQHANVLAAIALAHSIGVTCERMMAPLQQFAGLPHRVQWVGELLGIAFYDDSKATNVGASCAALSGLGRKVVLIAGGDGKGQNFAPLSPAAAQHARAIVLIGRDAAEIAEALHGLSLPVVYCDHLPLAVTEAFALAQPGDAVLLSPACASFDMFRNYIHRAEVFVSAVNQLISERVST